MSCYLPTSNIRTSPVRSVSHSVHSSLSIVLTKVVCKKRKLFDSQLDSQHDRLCDCSLDSSAKRAKIESTPPASPVSNNKNINVTEDSNAFLSNKSSASSLSLSVITDCSLHYLDTLPTNINKICNTSDDPWDLSDCECDEQSYKEYNDVRRRNHHSFSEFTSPRPKPTHFEENSPKFQSELQQMESFYINWRKNFEKWLLLKNPKKYSEYKSFLKYNTDTSAVSGTDESLSDSPRHYSSPRKSSRCSTAAAAARSSHALHDSSIKDKINRYLVKKPVFNSKISKKFKSKSTELILNNITRKRTSSSSAALSAYPLSSIIKNTRPIAPVAASSEIKLNPILTIPKNLHKKSTTTSTGSTGIRLPSINEILDSESFSVSHTTLPSPLGLLLNNSPQQNTTINPDRRSISTSSVESTNSVFSDTGSTHILLDDGLNRPSPQYALSPPLIAFKSTSSIYDSYNHHTVSPKKASPKKSTSPKKVTKSTHHAKRTCLSCGSSQSPCWRPSWSLTEGQLCNSCGLRYKKTNARCINNDCLRIPAKGEFNLIKSKANNIVQDYKCLRCGSCVEVK